MALNHQVQGSNPCRRIMPVWWNLEDTPGLSPGDRNVVPVRIRSLVLSPYGGTGIRARLRTGFLENVGSIPTMDMIGVWCNGQHNGLQNHRSGFESQDSCSNRKNCIRANSSEGEHMSCKHITRVRVPIGPFWGCSSVGRAPALQAGGSGFESHQLHFRYKHRCSLRGSLSLR